MRYLIIDPSESAITERVADGVIDLDRLRQLIGCEWVQRLSIDDRTDLWVDEEYLLTADQNSHFFHFGKSGNLLGGRAVVCGLSPGGNSIGLKPHITIDVITENVQFLGDLKDVVLGMEAGRINRPASYFTTDSETKKIWEWHPEFNSA